MKNLATAFLLATLGFANASFAQLKLTITQGVTDPINIAVVPFARAVPADGGVDVAAIIQRDLEGSGRFKAMPRTDMLGAPTTRSEIDIAGWKQQRNDYVVVGRLTAQANGDVVVKAELINLLTGLSMMDKPWTVKSANLRKAAHRIADEVYRLIIGVPGAFDTRI